MRVTAFIFGVATVLLPGLALAADYSPPPPAEPFNPKPYEEFNWGGLYGGIHAGYTTGDFTASGLAQQLSQQALRSLEITQQGSGLINFPATSDQRSDLGGFVGYQWAYDDAVVGFELSYHRPRNKLVGSVTDAIARRLPVSDSDVWDVSLNGKNDFSLTDYAMVKVRAGYAMGRFLPFVTLGAALGRGKIEAVVNSSYTQYDVTVDPTTNLKVYTPVSAGTGQGYVKKSGLMTGGTLGVGIDYAPIDYVFVRAEYSWLGFQDFKGQRVSLNTARLGVGLKY